MSDSNPTQLTPWAVSDPASTQHPAHPDADRVRLVSQGCAPAPCVCGVESASLCPCCDSDWAICAHAPLGVAPRPDSEPEPDSREDDPLGAEVPQSGGGAPTLRDLADTLAALLAARPDLGGVPLGISGPAIDQALVPIEVAWGDGWWLLEVNSPGAEAGAF